MKICIITT